MTPTAPGTPDGVQLSPEDQERTTKLREEAVARMTEMGLIVSRALNQEPELVTAMNIESEPRRTLVRIIFGETGGPDVCYFDPPGSCEFC